MSLALDEVVTNVVPSSFETSAGQEVAVRMETMGEVADGGRAFNLLTAPVPDLTAALDGRAFGGQGIHLVRSLVDRVECRRENAKNVLTMRKRIR